MVAVPFADDDPGELTEDELGPWLIARRREMDQSEVSWLLALAEFDIRRLWAWDGQLSCVAWLKWKLRMASSTAYEKLHVSHQLRLRPILAEAFGAGRISYSAARALSHMEDPDPETDKAMVVLAEEGTVRQLEFAIKHYNQIKDQERPPAEPESRRCLRVRPLGGGNSKVEAIMPDVEAMELLAAAEAMAAAQRRAARAGDSGQSQQGDVSTTSPGRSQEQPATAGADSSREEDERGTGAGAADDSEPDAGADAQEDAPSHADAAPDSSREEDAGEDAAQRRWRVSRAEALIDLVRLALAHADDGHAAGDDRYMVHLVGREGQMTTINGTPIDPEVAAGIACDASVVAHTVDDNGEPLRVGRKTKEWTTAQRRAVAVRDGGCCRYPGCERRIVDVHHRVFWSQGGMTDVDNALSLCRRHHRLLHHGFSAEAGTDGAVDFFRPDGTPIGTTYPAYRQLAFAA